MVIIQMICVRWTKKSRGAPGAERRNAVPKALPFTPADCNCLVEYYDFNEKNDFKQVLRERLIFDHIPDRFYDLQLDYQNDELAIGTHWDQRWAKPGRYDKTDALCLSIGQYGRLVVNWRSVDEHGEDSIHWYSQKTWNIAVVDHPTPDLFITREPDQFCDLRAHLF